MCKLSYKFYFYFFIHQIFYLLQLPHLRIIWALESQCRFVRFSCNFFYFFQIPLQQKQIIIMNKQLLFFNFLYQCSSIFEFGISAPAMWKQYLGTQNIYAMFFWLLNLTYIMHVWIKTFKKKKFQSETLHSYSFYGIHDVESIYMWMEHIISLPFWNFFFP